MVLTPKLRESVEFLGYSLLLLALVLCAVAGLNTYRNWELVHDWPTADGQIVSADVYQTTAKRLLWRTTVYGVRWLVRYSLDNRIYISSAVLAYQSGNRADIEMRATRLAPGAPVQVRYDPNDHGRIILTGRPVTESNPALVRLLEIAGTAILAGIVLLTYARRRAESTSST